jgi:hypothetical protein
MRGKMRAISIMVGKDFKVPALYTSESVDDIQDALWIGAMVQQQMRAYKSDGAVVELTEEYERKITELREGLGERISELERERSELEAKMVAAVRSARADGGEVVRRELEEEMRRLEERIVGIEERKRILEESRGADIDRAVSGERAAMERLVSEKEREISRMESVVKRLEEAIGRQSEEIRGMGAALVKRVNLAGGGGNVKVKGSLFETEFHERLVEAYGTVRDFDLRDTARGGGHEGDLIMNIEGEQIMWELKDYSSDVPKKEVDKFVRDMRDCKGARVGVMVSKTTGIMGKHGALAIEIQDGRLLIFVNRFEEWEAGGCIGGGGLFQILLQLFRLWWKVGAALSGEDGEDKGEEVEALQRRLEEGFVLITKYVGEMKTRRTEWRTHKGRMEETLRWVGGLLDDTEVKLERLLRCLQEEAGGGGDEDGEGVNEEKGTENSIFISDKKEAEWIKAVKSLCKVEVGGVVELIEIETALAEMRKTSRDTARAHILKIVRPECIEKKGAKKVIVGLVLLGK